MIHLTWNACSRLRLRRLVCEGSPDDYFRCRVTKYDWSWASCACSSHRLKTELWVSSQRWMLVCIWSHQSQRLCGSVFERVWAVIYFQLDLVFPLTKTQTNKKPTQQSPCSEDVRDWRKGINIDYSKEKKNLLSICSHEWGLKFEV